MSKQSDQDDRGLLSETSPVESMDMSPFDMRRGHLILFGDEPMFWVSRAQRPYVHLCGTTKH
jgi:hypothetical protein